MSKFGELIETPIPVLLCFYTESNQKNEDLATVLREAASALQEKAKVVKIDVHKNHELAEALKIKEIPTLMIYKNGEMKWRESGLQTTQMLINLMQEQL